MAESKIIGTINYDGPEWNTYKVEINLVNCNAAKARLFLHTSPPPGEKDVVPLEIFKHHKYTTIDKVITMPEGHYTFYLFCGTNLDDVEGGKYEIFNNLKSHCEYHSNECKMVTETITLSQQGGRRSSKRRRRSGGRRHRKSHRRR